MAKKKQNPLYAIYKRLNTPLKINIDLKLKEQKKIFQAKKKKRQWQLFLYHTKQTLSKTVRRDKEGDYIIIRGYFIKSIQQL